MSLRPSECSGCNKPCKITYKELSQSSSQTFEMCEECPLLKKKLYGEASSEVNEIKDLSCQRCGCSRHRLLDEQKMGCEECYEIFEQLTFQVMQDRQLLSPLTIVSKDLHIGKTPYDTYTVPLTHQMMDLTKALNRALDEEHYEEAAEIRDQIKKLKATSYE